ncbi:unnamed protein product [Vitrella brassicaformis CCMP3155]|uniref:Uncharacterized protein n=1 Tax=Vitrella brassicaformis (strain CCMP3155) TaxID=1169540 RepID=A0A0G4GP21_VITBC|nr:unnamed protein product [Vitrella brassicaformis CCMP3155]|eukprot:CEM32029.1 unnamed protein product [Vitrella brassicaformis CCMP3155]
MTHRQKKKQRHQIIIEEEATLRQKQLDKRRRRQQKDNNMKEDTPPQGSKCIPYVAFGLEYLQKSSTIVTRPGMSTKQMVLCETGSMQVRNGLALCNASALHRHLFPPNSSLRQQTTSSQALRR